jgi:hypothetical protein
MTTVTHEHRGGSVGGEGQNDAECACGTAFRGFDTHTDAMAVLDEHIADEAKAAADPWAQLAARIADQPLPDYRGELSRIAADVAALTGSGLDRPGYFSLKTELVIDIQPKGRDDEATARGVDAVAQMLLGHDGETKQMAAGNWHYSAYGARGPIEVRIYNSVSTEWAERWAERQKAAAERDELLAKLATAEADAAKLRAELAERNEYAPEGRTTAAAEAKPDTLGVALGHHGNGEVHLRPVTESGPTCGADVKGERCGLPIRPGHSRAWVHAAAVQAHDAVGPDQT